MDAHNDINFYCYSHTVQPLLGPKRESDQGSLELLCVTEEDAPEGDERATHKSNKCIFRMSPT